MKPIWSLKNSSTGVAASVSATCLKMSHPSSLERSLHPAPRVAKIRGVGVPETSSTKYVPGASFLKMLPSARGGRAGEVTYSRVRWSQSGIDSSLVRGSEPLVHDCDVVRMVCRHPSPEGVAEL